MATYMNVSESCRPSPVRKQTRLTGVWIGVGYAALSFVPAARANELTPQGFERGVDVLLQTTRWTGVALPITGGYQIWQLYPLARLLGTPRGHLVLGMLGLWGVMNGVLEVGVYRTRTAAGATMGIGRHTIERFSLGADTDVTRLASVVRPYVLVASGLGLLLLVDAALLAGGLPV